MVPKTETYTGKVVPESSKYRIKRKQTKQRKPSNPLYSIFIFYSSFQSARNSFLPMTISVILTFYTNGASVILQLILPRVLTLFPCSIQQSMQTSFTKTSNKETTEHAILL